MTDLQLMSVKFGGTISTKDGYITKHGEELDNVTLLTVKGEAADMVFVFDTAETFIELATVANRTEQEQVQRMFNEAGVEYTVDDKEIKYSDEEIATHELVLTGNNGVARLVFGVSSESLLGVLLERSPAYPKIRFKG